MLTDSRGLPDDRRYCCPACGHEIADTPPPMFPWTHEELRYLVLMVAFLMKAGRLELVRLAELSEILTRGHVAELHIGNEKRQCLRDLRGFKPPKFSLVPFHDAVSYMMASKAAVNESGVLVAQPAQCNEVIRKLGTEPSSKMVAWHLSALRNVIQLQEKVRNAN